MSAREQALPAALEAAVRECHRKGHGHAEDMLEALRAAWPAVRRELLAEVESERDEAMTALRALHHWCSDLFEGLEGPTGEDHIMESVARLISGEGETGGAAGNRSLGGRQDDRRNRPRSSSPDLVEVEAERVIPSALRAAMSAVRRELLAEAQPEPATAERVEQGEPAGWGTVEAVANRVLGKHAKHTVEHLLARLRPLWPDQPPASDAKSELIRIAAELARMEAPLPSNPEDHHQKTYSAGVVARAMERHEDALKELAVRVRRVFDKLPPAQPPASDEPAELPADWREAIVRAVSATVRRVVERLAGSERLDPPATPAEIANLAASDSADAALSALAPLVLGERLLESGLTVGEVARRRGVSRNTLYQQIHREGWVHVGTATPPAIDRLLRRALVADPRFTYEQIGRWLGGVSRQAIESQTRRFGWRVAKASHRPRTPAWERPSPADRRQVAELHALGMGVPEAMELLGYRFCADSVRRMMHLGPIASGRPYNESGWRGWKPALIREVGKLIAADAIRSGATYAEAAQVSGLPEGSVKVWASRGELPRSRNPRGKRKAGA